MLTIIDVPLNVYNRALELFGEAAEKTVPDARRALFSAESRLTATGPLTPFAYALGEYLSLAGPWSEESGEHAGESGYCLK